MEQLGSDGYQRVVEERQGRDTHAAAPAPRARNALAVCHSLAAAPSCRADRCSGSRAGYKEKQGLGFLGSEIRGFP